MRQGDRVSTSLGKGTVAYMRMAPPDYAEVDAVSVVLDAKRGQPGYTGTILAASDVRPEATGEILTREQAHGILSERGQ